MKKLLSALLVLLMLIPAIPVFRVAAEDTSAAIKEVVIELSELPRDGGTRPSVTADGRFNITNNYWLGAELVNGKFVAGKTYTLSVRLLAFKGYAFSEDVFITAAGKAPKSVERFTDNGFDGITAEFEFYVSSRKEIGYVTPSIDLSLVPRAGGLGDCVFTTSFTLGTYAQQVSFERNGDSTDIGYWIDAETRTSVYGGSRFKYGKTYYIEFNLKANFPTEYKFTEKTTFGLSNVGSYVADVTLIDSSKIRVRLMIRAAFASSGTDPNNPITCYSFEDLKGALENPDFKYVELGYVPDPGSARPNVPVIHGSSSDRYYAILQTGTHVLTVNETASFRFGTPSPSSHALPVALIGVTGDLTVKGSGIIQYFSAEIDTPNAIFANRGKLTFDGNVRLYNECTGISSKKYVTRAVYQNYSGATLTVNDGEFDIRKTQNTNSNHAAIDVRAGRATINGGFFKFTKSYNATSADVYGLSVSSGANVSIKGGVFCGILLPAGKTIGDYTPASSIITVDGSAVPRSANEQLKSGTVAIRGRIESVNVYVNSPQAGKTPDFTGSTATEGAAVEKVTWYDSTAGRNLTENDTFTAGHSYSATTRVRADDYHKFNTTSSGGFSITVKLNGTSVTPKKIGGSSAADVFEVTATLGVCPNTIYDIDVTVTPPVAGRRVNQTNVTFGATTYGLFPTDPVTWYDVTGETRTMKPAEQFVEGRSYRVEIWVKAKSGYNFETAPGWKPGVAATVNGEIVTPQKAYEQSPDEVISLTYDFGTYHTTVNTAHVLGFEKPVGGGSPSFNITSAHPELYTVDSLSWTGSTAMKPGDKFEYSKTYSLQFRILMNTQNGEELYKFSPNVGVYMDGNMIESSDYTVFDGAIVVAMTFRTAAEPQFTTGSGDVDGDGDLTMKDVLLMRRYIAGLDELTPAQIARGDIDTDGDVTMKDVLRARRIIAGLD